MQKELDWDGSINTTTPSSWRVYLIETEPSVCLGERSDGMGTGAASGDE